MLEFMTEMMVWGILLALCAGGALLTVVLYIIWKFTSVADDIFPNKKRIEDSDY